MLVLRYFSRLDRSRRVLWSYLIWWACMVTLHFDSSAALWGTSLGLSGVIGIALWLSTRSSATGVTRLDGWQLFRLFLMPFCVSSFAALVKGKGFWLVFSGDPGENLIGASCIVGFLLAVEGLSRVLSD